MYYSYAIYTARGWVRSDTFVFKINFKLFYEKMLSCRLIFPKALPGPPPFPYLVRIQDSEFTGTFDLIPYFPVNTVFTQLLHLKSTLLADRSCSNLVLSCSPLSPGATCSRSVLWRWSSPELENKARKQSNSCSTGDLPKEQLNVPGFILFIQVIFFIPT